MNSSGAMLAVTQGLETVLDTHIVPRAPRVAVGVGAVDLDEVGEVGPFGAGLVLGQIPGACS